MTLRLPGSERLLLFRSYLFLVASLLLVALLLDLGFGHLQSREAGTDERWLAATFDLIERELASVPPDQRTRVAAELANEIGTRVTILEQDDVYVDANRGTAIPALIDADGNRSYLHDAVSIDALIRLGPVAEAQGSILLRLLPPIFYLSIFVIVGIWLRPLLRDINRITRGAQRFAADYREPLATAEDATELKGLAENLDDMSARLSGLIQNQKELIAALSHEMRTPLARIRFALALIGKKCDDDLQKPLGEVDRDVQEIDDLIAAMLNYARLDHPDLRMNWQQVPVEPWLAQTLDKSRPTDRDIALESDETAGTAWMDARLMALALSNLLVNACRYASGSVRCTFNRRGNEYRIDVDDDGDGIPEPDRKSIFRAFARLDGSRSRDTGGHGLGLAIVARIAALHGGTAEVTESPELGGARFTLRWVAPTS